MQLHARNKLHSCKYHLHGRSMFKILKDANIIPIFASLHIQVSLHTLAQINFLKTPLTYASDYIMPNSLTIITHKNFVRKMTSIIRSIKHYM